MTGARPVSEGGRMEVFDRFAQQLARQGERLAPEERTVTAAGDDAELAASSRNRILHAK